MRKCQIRDPEEACSRLKVSEQTHLMFALTNGTKERLLKKTGRSLKHEMERKKTDNQLFASIS